MQEIGTKQTRARARSSVKCETMMASTVIASGKLVCLITLLCLAMPPSCTPQLQSTSASGQHQHQLQPIIHSDSRSSSSDYSNKSNSSSRIVAQSRPANVPRPGAAGSEKQQATVASGRSQKTRGGRWPRDAAAPQEASKPILISDPWRAGKQAPCPPMAGGHYSAPPLPPPSAVELDETGERLILLERLLSRHYKVPASSSGGMQQTSNDSSDEQQQQQQHHQDERGQRLVELPRPTNVTLLIISWYPPILKLSWNLDELGGERTNKLDFYSSHDTKMTDDQQQQNRSQVDLELALGDSEQQPADEEEEEDVDEEPDARQAAELRHRRLLIQKSLTCFQVTYNIINSRFKVTEEYPPYLRSVMLERLLPATEYSLRVAAVYLGKHRQLSERVQFVSPTDNESRRFKENTYRPIHHYPDERAPLRIGLAQVRSEELTIVAFAVLFWVATICLFFNKWGKIRMLEPYQPAYRESSSTASLITATAAAAAAATEHHHPSLHNAGSLAGSCSGATPIIVSGGGGKLSAGQCSTASQFSGAVTTEHPAPLTGGAAAPVAAAVSATCAATASPASSAGTVVPVAAVGQSQPAKAQWRLDSGPLAAAAGGRKSSKSMLLLGHGKRYDSITGTESLIPASSSSGAGSRGQTPGIQRTDAELNYLFQSKALALAKATSIWSRHQQKLRLFQSQAAACGSLSSTDPAAASLQQLGAIRRTSQALLRQRGALGSQQHQQQLLGEAGHLGHHHHGGGIAAAGSLDCRRESRATADDVSRAQLMRLLHQQSQKAPDSPKFWSLDKQTGGSEQPQASDQTGCPGTVNSHHQQLEHRTSNKLRRLLFTTRSHQHHHIATSTSSSTIQVSGCSQSAGQPPGAWATRHSSTGSNSPRLNSSSLDNDPCRQRLDSAGQRPYVQPQPPAPLAAGGHRSLASTRQGANTSTSSNGSSGSATNSSASGNSGESMRSCELPGCLRAEPHEWNESMQQRGSLVEHHILIEPPSPPNQRDLFESGTRSAGAQPAPAGEHFDWTVTSSEEPAVVAPSHHHHWHHELKPQQQHKQQHADSCEAANCHLAGRPLAGSAELDNKSPQLATTELGPQQRQQSRPCVQAAESCCVALARARAAKQRRSCLDLQDNTLTGESLPAGTLSQQPEQKGRRQQQRIAGDDELSEESCDNGRAKTAAAPDDDGDESRGRQQARKPADLTEEQARLDWVEQRARESFARLADYRRSQAEARSLAQQSSSYCSPVQLPNDSWAHCSCCCCPAHCPAAPVNAPTAPATQFGGQLHAQAPSAHAAHHHPRHRSLCTEMVPGFQRQLTAAGLGGGHHRSSVQFQVSEHTDALDEDDDDDGTGCCQVLDAGGHPGASQRPRMSSVFVSSPYTRAHHDSFAMLRALSQKKSKSAEDVAYLSSLVLQIWARDRNPLLQSVSQQQLATAPAGAAAGNRATRRQQSAVVESSQQQMARGKEIKFNF